MTLRPATHRNAPLTVEGRRRLVERCRTRPIAHVAAEMGISRATASKWVNRYREYGDIGLFDRPSVPRRQPTATRGDVVARIESMRRDHKWSAARIVFELEQQGVGVSRRTVSRILAQLQLNRRRFIDPCGETNREPQQILAQRPGHMVHLDVKKVGRIPDGGVRSRTPGGETSAPLYFDGHPASQDLSSIHANRNTFTGIPEGTLMVYRPSEAGSAPLDATNNCWGTKATGPANYTFSPKVNVTPWCVPANPDSSGSVTEEPKQVAPVTPEEATVSFPEQVGAPTVDLGTIKLGEDSGQVLSMVQAVPNGSFAEVPAGATTPFTTGGSNVYLNITLDKPEGATVTGPFTVCVDSTSNSQRLWHWESGKWVDITTSNKDGRVCGVTDSFSPFVLAEKKSDPAPTPTPSKVVLKHNKKPRSLKAKGKATGNKFKVSWKKPSNTSAKRPVSKYKLTVQVRGKKKVVITKNVSKKKRSYTLTRKQLLKALRLSTRGEINRAAYRVKVRAVNARGNGPAAAKTFRMIVR